MTPTKVTPAMLPRDTIRMTFLAALLLTCLLFLYLPSEIFSRNPFEFNAEADNILRHLLPWWAVALAALFVPVLIPNDHWRLVYSTLLTALAVSFWIASVFMVVDTGPLDGKNLDLSAISKRLWLHAVAFVSAVVVAAGLLWKFRSALQTGVVLLTVGLLLLAAYNFFSASQVRTNTINPVEAADIATFSPDRNLLILVLDTFQSDIFDTITAQDPETRRVMDGFVFFPDTLGVAPSTLLTMPAMHSGAQYDRVSSLRDFYQDSVDEGSFLVEMAKNGYQVSLINPIADACPIGASVCAYQERLLLENKALAKNEALRLLAWSAFRAMPGPGKEAVMDQVHRLGNKNRDKRPLYGLERKVYDGNMILGMIADHLSATSRVPTAKFIHLFNTHPPFLLDSACNFIGVQNGITRKLQTQQTRCAMKWVGRLFDAMKQQDIYDNTLVILTADTGAGNAYADDDLSSRYAQEQGLEPGGLARLMGGANPVLAIKWPDEHGDLQISNAQAQLTDIPKTVCSSLTACMWRTGVDLGEETGSHHSRLRYYDYYKWETRFWQLEYIPGIRRYEVSGPLWLGDSWRLLEEAERVTPEVETQD